MAPQVTESLMFEPGSVVRSTFNYRNRQTHMQRQTQKHADRQTFTAVDETPIVDLKPKLTKSLKKKKKEEG